MNARFVIPEDAPYIILVRPERIQRSRIWKIKLRFLLERFWEDMQATTGIDYVTTGIVVETSSLIYYEKVKRIFQPDEPPPRRSRRALEDFIPPPVPFPYISPYTSFFRSLPISEYLRMIEELLHRENLVVRSARPFVKTKPEDVLQLIEHIDRIEAQRFQQFLTRFETELLGILEAQPIVLLSEVLSRLGLLSTKPDLFTPLLACLFLASEGKIWLLALDDETDLIICHPDLAPEEEDALDG